MIVSWISWFDEKGIQSNVPVAIEARQVREKLVAGLLDNIESDAGIDLDSVHIKGRSLKKMSKRAKRSSNCSCSALKVNDCVTKF